MINGVASEPFSATTLAPSPDFYTGNAEKVINVSRERYTNPVVKVEEKISRWMGSEYHQETALMIGEDREENQKNEEAFNEEPKVEFQKREEKLQPKQEEKQRVDGERQNQEQKQQQYHYQQNQQGGQAQQRRKRKKKKKKSPEQQQKHENPIWQTVANIQAEKNPVLEIKDKYQLKPEDGSASQMSEASQPPKPQQQKKITLNPGETHKIN